MFSSTSFGEWTKMGETVDGNTFYVDFERIRKHDGYVYWWDMVDYLKPDEVGTFSVKYYQQGDCKLFRTKPLSYSFHKEPMGGGTGLIDSSENEWIYPTPNSGNEVILEEVCSQ